MTTHLSVRLAWHDRAWDGHVCDLPHLNAHCIVHQHIRDSRDDEKERGAAGNPLVELDGWLPPCSRDPAAYAEKGFSITHQDPLEFRRLPGVSEDIPPYSSCPAPYRWMREEFFREVCEAEDISLRGPDNPRSNGWVFEPDRQRELLKRFWGKLEPKNSLVFYYCNHGNPLDENSPRIIVGIGRIAEVGPQFYFGTTPKYQDQYPVWSRRISQAYPEQGVRIPYQEYLRDGHSTDDIICRVPRSALLPFSYGGEHVSDDVAVAIIERVIQCVERVKADGRVAFDWERRLDWLNDVLAEAWSGRGAFPGAGSVLQYLGFSKGTSFQRTVLAQIAKRGENSWDYVLSILEGRIEPDKGTYRTGLLKARERWRVLKNRHALLSKLARLELTPGQVQRIANPDQRAASGIDATERDLVANPYILSECDLGSADSDPVALETVDHGLRPEGDAALFPDADEISHEDRRWQFGIPPAGNANFAWVQHFIYHLSPSGTTGFVLANGSMSSNTSGEGEIRKNIIEADLVDCMVALPGQLFYSTQIPVCLWFVARDKRNGRFRDRRGQVLFIDARKLGALIDRVHRDLTDEDIAKIADTYHAWRGGSGHSRESGNPVIYQDIPGFCKSATLDDVRTHGHVLTPGRYVGAEKVEDDSEPLEEKMKQLTSQLQAQFKESATLEKTIRKNLAYLGFLTEKQ